MSQLFQSVTSQVTALIDFEQKSLLCTHHLPLFLPFCFHTPFFTNCSKQTPQEILTPPRNSLRPLNSIQPSLLEHLRPPRIHPPHPLHPLPPQPPIRMLLTRHLHLLPRTLPRLPIRTRSPTPTRPPILSPTYPRLYTVSNR